jgi:hypothetical protein
MPILTIKSLLSYIACHDSLDPLFQNLGIWIQGSGAAGHVSSVTYFLDLLEDKDRRLKIKLTLSLILRVNLRHGGYSIWSASLIAPHIKEGLTTTRGMITSQPRCSQGSTQKTPSRWSSGGLKYAFRSFRKPAVLDYEELRGLSDLGTRDCAHGVLFLGYGIGHGPHPISIVTTPSIVELLIQ